jgi:hypothetical protein
MIPWFQVPRFDGVAAVHQIQLPMLLAESREKAMGIEQIQSAKTRRYCPLFNSIGVK